MKENGKQKKYLYAVFPILLIFLLLLLFIGRNYMQHRADHRLLRDSTYNSVFLSMYPANTFDKEDFAHFRADNVLILDTADTYRELKHDLKDVAASGNALRVIYLGVDPEKITGKQILQLSEKFPGVIFEVIPAYRPTIWWATASPEALKAYRSMADTLTGLENIRLYSFFASEWLVANPQSYLAGTQLCHDAAHLVYVYTDDLHGYMITPENKEQVFLDFSDLYQKFVTSFVPYPDLSQKTILFFGDSVIGNTTDYTSIPELVSLFTGADCYNCGVGGSSATPKGDFPFSVNEVLDAYLSGSVSSLSEEVQAYHGLTAYFNKKDTFKDENLLFVLHYGLNDYFDGQPIASEDPRDPATFTGSLRIAIDRLQKTHPEAEILLIAPNFTNYFQNGTMINSEEGSIFTDYIQAICQIAEEYSLPLLNNYQDVITPDNASQFLADGCHPNESGRFRIAEAIANLAGGR